MTYRYLALLAGFLGLVGGLIAFRQEPATAIATDVMIQSDISGLANYRDELVQYATISRPDNRTRDLFISAGAAERVANNSTARLPSGTIIVIEAHFANGDPDVFADNIHVAVKSDTWTAADYQTPERAGSWNYFSFDPATGQVSDESLFECFDCHANNSQIDFIFSRDELADFGQSGTVQDSFCNRPNRLPCR
jgi:hypothetical protein